MNQDRAYFVRVEDDRYRPTPHVGGAWDAAEQHFSPMGGLIVHAIEAHCAHRGLVLCRISFDILGRLPMKECDIQVRTLRPGRTIELVEAQVHADGRTLVQARAWLLAPGDTRAVAGGGADALPAPEELRQRSYTSIWPGGYIASLDLRPVGTVQPGRGTVWVSSDVVLIEGEPIGSAASFVALIDTANGIAVREEPTQWMFPNVDLTVHLHRRPRGSWVGLDTRVVFGPSGQGRTSSVLHDEDGEVGHAEQILTVRPLNPQ